MASSGYPVSLLQFQLPHSPLLSGCMNLSDDFFSTLSAQGICSPLPTFSFASPKSPRSPALLTPRTHCYSSLSPVRSKSKPPPKAPPPAIPPKQIIALLNLLDQMDEDTMKDVQRVNESIKEVYDDIAEVRAELEVEEKQLARRRAKEKRDTKGIDDEFWLNA